MISNRRPRSVGRTKCCRRIRQRPWSLLMVTWNVLLCLWGSKWPEWSFITTSSTVCTIPIFHGLGFVDGFIVPAVPLSRKRSPSSPSSLWTFMNDDTTITTATDTADPSPSSSSFFPSVEDGLTHHATPLLASKDRASAERDLLANGVCRLDGVLSQSDCSHLKRYIEQWRGQDGDDDNVASGGTSASPLDDYRHIPGTRLRFAEPMVIPLNRHRMDLLLPIEDPVISSVLQRLVEELGDVLMVGAQGLPQVTDTTSLELIEAACLISETGATHQSVHADFRRDADRPTTRLAPRIVTFLYLQDSPTKHHGPTIFLPGTNSPTYHEVHYNSNNRSPQSNRRDSPAWTTGGQGSSVDLRNDVHDPDHDTLDRLLQVGPKCATLSCGDVAIYDASVLHFGSANTAPDNTRMVLYFGVTVRSEGDGRKAITSNPIASSTRNQRSDVAIHGGVDNVPVLHQQLESLPPVSLGFHEILQSNGGGTNMEHHPTDEESNYCHISRPHGQSSSPLLTTAHRRYYWKHQSIKGLVR